MDAARAVLPVPLENDGHVGPLSGNLAEQGAAHASTVLPETLRLVLVIPVALFHLFISLSDCSIYATLYHTFNLLSSTSYNQNTLSNRLLSTPYLSCIPHVSTHYPSTIPSINPFHLIKKTICCIMVVNLQVVGGRSYTPSLAPAPRKDYE
jgi:hypothetical protein